MLASYIAATLFLLLQVNASGHSFDGHFRERHGTLWLEHHDHYVDN